eukprot:TRINITY_DN10888_c0_g1_i9.p2 TRINITY_DN10888_c0_g1~~TRINITY_DN10888_c0_g1_i9.p2  ORF type:complete len:133 (-),score=22.69 TRINITY_DN10888_c0_g1_i9:599-997(-)
MRKISILSLVALHVYLVGFIIANLLANIKTLKVQLSSLQDSSMYEIFEKSKKKVTMFVLYGVAIFFYYSFYAVWIGLPAMVDLKEEKRAGMDRAEKVVCMLTLASITTIFHPCFFTEAFQMGQIPPLVLAME